MKYTIASDHPVTNDSAKASTGKTLDQWFRELDAIDGLKQGRRALNVHLNGLKVDPWWCATIAVEYEKHHDVRMKDGNYEGYFVCSTKTIAAPASEVYAAWVNVAKLNQWFGGSLSGEVKDAGKVQDTDGDQLDFLRVRKDKDLRFDLSHPSFSRPIRIDVQFQDKGKGKTGLLVNLSRIQTREEADGIRNSWAEALNRLKEVCEAK